MTDLLIPGLDDDVIRRLQARAQAEGISLHDLAVWALHRTAFPRSAAELAAELAALRASRARRSDGAVAEPAMARRGDARSHDGDRLGG